MLYLNLCAIVKDEKRSYLEEFVRYHEHLGVEQFTLYNNGVPIAPLPYTRIIECPGKAIQLAVYRHFIETFRDEAVWTAIIDLDEFIVPHAWPTIPDMLGEYEDYGALGLNWAMFGGNGQPDDDRPQTVKFTRRVDSSYSECRHIKSLVQLKNVLWMPDPHHAEFIDTTFTVDASKQRIYGPFREPADYSMAQINHYYFRSIPEYERKMQSVRADTATLRWRQDESKCNEIEDLAAKKIWESM